MHEWETRLWSAGHKFQIHRRPLPGVSLKLSERLRAFFYPKVSTLLCWRKFLHSGHAAAEPTADWLTDWLLARAGGGCTSSTEEECLQSAGPSYSWAGSGEPAPSHYEGNHTLKVALKRSLATTWWKLDWKLSMICSHIDNHTSSYHKSKLKWILFSRQAAICCLSMHYYVLLELNSTTATIHAIILPHKDLCRSKRWGDQVNLGLTQHSVH